MVPKRALYPIPYALCSLCHLGLLCAMLSALCIFVLSGCQAKFFQVRAPLEEEGEVYLYIQPFPQEANRLKFKIDGISAIRDDGAEFPFSLSLSDLKGRDMRRQRLLGSVRLPPGSYSGLSFKIKEAFLKVEEGEAALLVPGTPVKTNFLFHVSRKRASVISLIFKYPESVRQGFSFSPVFSIFIPPKPITSVVGFVSNSGSNNITVFDKMSGQVAAVIATGRRPTGMAIDQRLRKAYVVLSGDDRIEVVDVTAVEVIDKINLSIGDHPQEMAITPDGKFLVTANTGSNTASIIDLFSLTEVSRVRVGNGPNSVLMDPSGRRAYVFNTLSNTISVIDMGAKALVTNISTDPSPLRGQFNRRGDRFYVINEIYAYLTVVDPFSLSILKRASVSGGLNAIKVDTNTDLIYLGSMRNPVVDIYNPSTYFPIDYIRAGAGIAYMTIDGEERKFYMVSPEKNSLITSDLVSKRVLSEMDVGERPYWVTMMGER